MNITDRKLLQIVLGLLVILMVITTISTYQIYNITIKTHLSGTTTYFNEIGTKEVSPTVTVRNFGESGKDVKLVIAADGLQLRKLGGAWNKKLEYNYFIEPHQQTTTMYEIKSAKDSPSRASLTIKIVETNKKDKTIVEWSFLYSYSEEKERYILSEVAY